MLGIGLGGQRRDRDLDEIGVAQVLAAVGIGELHRLGHEVDGLGAARAEKADRIALEDVQDLDDVHAARGWRRHRDDLVAAVVALHRRAHHRLVAPEVVEAQMTAGAPHRGHDLLADRAAVERPLSLLRDQPEG